MVKVSRSIKEIGIKINQIQRNQINKTGEELKIDELATILEVSKEDIIIATEALRPVESTDVNAYQDSESNMRLLDTFNSGFDEESQIINKISIKEALNKLNKKEREIIALRYYKEKTQTQVARILGITQVQVSRLEKKILNSMKNNLSKTI